MKKIILSITCLMGIALLSGNNLLAQRYMENLNRGTVAVRTSSSAVLVSWRILGPEYTNNATYNLYRGSTLIASGLNVSNYVDNTGTDNPYSVAAVINGTEQAQSAGVTPWADFYRSIPLSVPSGGTTPDGVSYTYEPNDCSVGDLDGDGDYEIVLKWYPTNAKDNANSGYTGNTILEGLEMDGTSLWRINLGRNIRSGAHYTQFMVYDLDGDGDAEVACKTADGTVDGQGNVIGSSSADYRTSSGYILSGPEYLTVFSGTNGAALQTVNYVPARGTVSDWGDSYGNRVDRFLACIAYLDGSQPSLVMCRGYYTRTVLAAWDYRNGSLTQRWVFDSDNGYSSYTGQGAHSIAVGDVDNDGKDEIMYGAAAIDDDGTGLYSTGWGHGDATHLADVDPNSSGLEFFMCHESANGSTRPGLSLRNAATGAAKWTVAATGDIGRGISMDIDPNNAGYECWSSDGSGVHTATGSVITTTLPSSTGGGASYNFGIWWDGDVQREILDRTVINKWNSSSNSTSRLVTVYNYGVSSNNSTKYTPCLSGDIIGDWREEVIYRSSDNSSLVIFSTPNSTSQRMYTLMHDPVYRLSIAWQNVAYNQPPNLGFYFGGGMGTPPNPDIQIVGETGGCTPTTITPYTQIDGGSWSQTASATVDAGGSVKFGPQPASGGSWSWSGPNGFSATTREVTISNIQTSQAGDYIATYTNSSGCQSTQTFNVTVDGGSGGSIVVRARGTDGGEQIQLVAGGSTLATWTLTTSYQDFSASGSGAASVYFINDNGSLDVQIDYITNNGTTYQAEDQATNTGVWSGTCGGSYSEWLHCNGYIQFDTPEGSPTPVTLTIQENETGFCSVDGTIDSNNSGYTGTGFANTNNASGNGVSWSVNIPSSGSYDLVWQYANGGSTDRTAQLMVDGSTVVSNVSFPATGSWTSWASTSATSVSLSAGNRVIRVQATNSAGLGNVDYMGITGINPTGVSCTGVQSAELPLTGRSGVVGIFPNPVQGSAVQLSLNLDSKSKVKVDVYTRLGQVIKSSDLGTVLKGHHRLEIDIPNLQKGTYYMKIELNSAVETVPFVKM